MNPDSVPWWLSEFQAPSGYDAVRAIQRERQAVLHKKAVERRKKQKKNLKRSKK